MVPAPQPPENGANSAANRAAARGELRRRKIAAREAMPAAEHDRCCALIEAHLEAELRRRPPSHLAFCWPIRGEFDARPLVGRLLARGWRASMPVVAALDAPMVFKRWTPETAMAADPHGIPVPDVAATCAAPDVLLLPLVAFDARGYRLGYGGGYFDRTLATLVPRPFAIGVGFALGREEDLAPEPHDIPLDAVVTETGLLHFSDHR